MVGETIQQILSQARMQDFCIQVGRTIIHGSDSVKSPQEEISLQFKPEELVDYMSSAHDWIDLTVTTPMEQTILAFTNNTTANKTS